MQSTSLLMTNADNVDEVINAESNDTETMCKE